MNLHTPCDVSLASNEVRYHSAHPTEPNNLMPSHNISASEQRAAARCNRGGDDPIRTDGALRGHSALAVRCLRPLGHVSLKSLVGMERFELSRAKALVSKTSVSPISTTSPRLSNSMQLGYTSSNQVHKYEPTDTNGGLPGTRTLKVSQLLRLPRLPIPPEARINENPSISRGVLAIPLKT